MKHMYATRVQVLSFLIILYPTTASGQNVISDLSGLSSSLSVMIAALFIASQMKSRIYLVSFRQMAAMFLSHHPRLGFLVPQRKARSSEYITDFELTTAGTDETHDVALIRNRDVLRISRKGWEGLGGIKDALPGCLSNYLPRTRAKLVSHLEKMLFFRRCYFPGSLKNFPPVRSSVVALEWLMTEAQEELDLVMAELVEKYKSVMDLDLNAWNDIVEKALDHLQHLTSGQVAGYCAALACPELAILSIESTNHQTTGTPLSTAQSPSLIPDSWPPGTVTAMITLLTYAARMFDADSGPLSVVISSFNGFERINFSRQPNKLAGVLFDFIQKRADSGGPINEIRYGDPPTNAFELFVRFGLIALVCTGVNATPLAAQLTADIFALKRATSVWAHMSFKHKHIIASKGIACVRPSAFIASFRTRGMELAIRAVVDVVGILFILFTESGIFHTVNAPHVAMSQFSWWSIWFMMVGIVPLTKE
ncbi:hypothetical protein K440DRAFT_639317 [Wilcoxina mikolae CBS 423.85]|nr:hypothetical protein K440DRAFT_639317 [Wilcoxina mikolae CBS 423.85]